MAATAATAAAVTTGGVAVQLFRYNRGNYRFDQYLRWFRFTTARNLACAQVDQYRQDVEDICGMTTNRMDQYNAVAGCQLTLLVAISCAGRLGLHHPAPPGWLMGHMLTNLSASFMFLILSIWVGIFAALRAHSVQVHMNTRLVRLPVPTQRMLDKVRNLSTNFERQKAADMFRVPFLAHSNDIKTKDESHVLIDDDEYDPDCPVNSHQHATRPTWMQAERRFDQGHAVLGKKGDVPMHFELLRELQHDWWPHDIYSRVLCLYGYLHLLNGWVAYQICHAMVEDRAPFACFSSITILICLQLCLLRLDILPGKGQLWYPYAEVIGPLGSYISYIACFLEYLPAYNKSADTAARVLVLIQYLILIFYEKRLLDLATPDTRPPPEASDGPGKPWWPGSWRVPASFSQVLYAVAPPKRLMPGENDLAGEIARGSGAKPFTPPKATVADIHEALGRRGETTPWKITRTAIIGLMIIWTVEFIGSIIEAVQGQGKILHPPGTDAWTRDPRWRPDKPGSNPETYAGPPLPGYGRGHGWFPCPEVFCEKGTDSWPKHERRLHALENSGTGLETAAQSLIPRLEEVQAQLKDNIVATSDTSHLAWRVAALEKEMAARGLYGSGAIGAVAVDKRAEPVPVNVQWPKFMEPRLLACGPGNGIAAIAARGLGVIADISGSSESTQFALEGIAELGRLVGTSWDSEGLLVTAQNGQVAECQGTGPRNSRWRCVPLRTRLPILGGAAGGQKIAAAAVARIPDGLQAALVFAGKPTSLLLLRSKGDGAPWLPAGETKLRISTSGAVSAASFVMDGVEPKLLISSEDGSVLQWSLHSANPKVVLSAERDVDTVFHAACGFTSGDVARLAYGSVHGHSVHISPSAAALTV